MPSVLHAWMRAAYCMRPTCQQVLGVYWLTPWPAARHSSTDKRLSPSCCSFRWSDRASPIMVQRRGLISTDIVCLGHSRDCVAVILPRCCPVAAAVAQCLVADADLVTWCTGAPMGSVLDFQGSTALSHGWYCAVKQGLHCHAWWRTVKKAHCHSMGGHQCVPVVARRTACM